MTTPLAQGYPDWARQASEAQVLEVDDLSATHNGTFNYPIRYVGNAKAFLVFANSNTMGVQFGFSFYANSAGTQLLGQYTIDCNTVTSVNQSVPMLGPYMRPFVIPSAAGNYNYTFIVSRVPQLGVFAGDNQSAGDISIIGGAIGAASTVINVCSIVQESHVYWNASNGVAGWEARLESVDYTGQVFVRDRINSSFDRVVRPAWVPAMPLQIRIVNSGAATQYDMFLSRSYNQFR